MGEEGGEGGGIEDEDIFEALKIDRKRCISCSQHLGCKDLEGHIHKPCLRAKANHNIGRIKKCMIQITSWVGSLD